MRLAKGMTASNQGDGLRIVHAHASKGGADIQRRLLGVAVPVRPLRVNVDEAHVGSSKRLFQLSSTGGVIGAAVVADVIPFGHKGRLAAPVDTLIRLPRVGSASAKTEDREAHAFEGNVTSQEHQVGPRDGGSILLLDGPQQAPRLVEVAVVRPAVERGKTLLALNKRTRAMFGQPLGQSNKLSGSGTPKTE